MKINLQELLNVYADLTVYEIKPEDKEKPAAISMVDWKEAMLAINVCNRRILDLLNDLEHAEKKIDKLERRQSTTDDQEDQILRVKR